MSKLDKKNKQRYHLQFPKMGVQAAFPLEMDKNIWAGGTKSCSAKWPLNCMLPGGKLQLQREY
jgi:hypothetical protein